MSKMIAQPCWKRQSLPYTRLRGTAPLPPWWDSEWQPSLCFVRRWWQCVRKFSSRAFYTWRVITGFFWDELNLPHGSDVSNNPVFFFCLYVIILPPCSTVCDNPTPCSTVYNKYLEFLHQRAWHTWFQFFCVYVGPCVCLFFILLLYPGRSILLF